MKNNKWDKLKKFHAERTGNSEHLVDLLSVLELLEQAVAGASIPTICDNYEVDEGSVIEILSEYLDFNGWETDLSINPLSLWRSVGGNYEGFERVYTKFSNDVVDYELLGKMYELCVKYDDLESEIDTYYD